MAKPSGLKITRNKLKFTVEWTPHKDYKDGQEWEYTITWSEKTGTLSSVFGSSVSTWGRGGETVSALISGSIKKKVISLDPKKYFPQNTKRKLVSVSVRVRGYKTKNGKNTWSGWASKTFAINTPAVPTFESTPAELDQNDEHKSTFIVRSTYDDTGSRPFSSVEYQSILVENPTTSNGKDYVWNANALGWKTGKTTSTNYTVPIGTETYTPTAEKTYTRFVRARALGVGGESEWKYCYHNYSVPRTPTMQTERDENAQQSEIGEDLIIDLTGQTNGDARKPIDYNVFQYVIGEPTEGMNPPLNPNWQDVQTTGDFSGTDRVYSQLDAQLERDQCLWVRLGSKHDNNVSWGSPVLSHVGYLKDPTNLSVQINWETHRVTVTATNMSDVDDSCLAVVINGKIETVIGIIPHGENNVTLSFPSDAIEGRIDFGVYAVVGEYSGGRISPYDRKPLMRSKNTLWKGGSVPLAPTNVTVNPTNQKGTVIVGWDWSWADADSAQIAWSDNPLAWESTDEPNDYTITNLNPSHWYVSDLETGKKWYFRVRLLQTNDDTITYGSWSEMVTIDLSSAPAKPVLTLSEYVITKDSMTTAYWAYVSTDGTPQMYAEICEATITNGIEYGVPFIHTETAQHIDLYPEEWGWETGETHFLCVRTVSGSGKPSDGWSDPVALQIAESITATITEDSLETQSIEVNPQTHSGNPITFNNPDGVLEFAKLRVDLEPTQDGTGDPSPSNVRPIHGIGSVEVEDVADEQYDFSKVVIGKNWIDGNDATRAVLKFSAKPNTKYNVVAKGGNFATILFIQMNGYNQITNQGIYPYDGTITTQGNCDNVIIQWQKSSAIATADFNGFECRINEGEISITQPLTTTLQPIASDDEPYLMRAMPYGDATNLTENLVGGTVAWNQLVQNGNFENTDNWFSSNGTLTAADNIVTMTQETEDQPYANVAQSSSARQIVQNHRYLYMVSIKSEVWANSGNAVVLAIGGFWVMPLQASRLSTNAWNDLTGIYTGHANVNWLLDLRKYYESSLTPMQVKNFKVFDLTAMFGTTIADAIYAMEQATAGAGVAWFKKLFPKSYYPYDAGSLQSVKPSAHVTKDADDNVVGNYPLPNIELRGIPKWVNGKLSYDGDILEPSGRLTRKYGIVDLGTLTWNENNITVDGNSAKLYRASLSNSALVYNSVACICSKYPTVLSSNRKEKTVSVGTSDGSVDIIESTYTDAASFKTAMSGVYLVYELATATTETVASFESNQLVSAGGTESYTDTRTVPIPVGHKSTYKTSHVYGGYVDLVSGELVVDRAVVDLGSLTWTYKSSTFNGSFGSNIPNMKQNTAESICSKYKSVPSDLGSYNNAIYTKRNGNFVYVRDTSYTDADTFKEAMNGVTLVYELATPIRTTLSSRELSALTGRNTLTGGGNMQIRLAEGITETECLTRLPLTVTVEGAGEGGVTTLAIERSEDFHLDRPDETDFNGYQGETVVLLSHDGEDEFEIEKDDIVFSNLDDGADYQIVATTRDAYGQTAEAKKVFTVRWEHQAIMPEGTVTIDGNLAYITPTAVSGSEDGDSIDIYRLSADRPELIYSGAEFGETYVDPYPAIGGGYRLVYVTKNGDYKTADGDFAWTDIESGFEYDKMIIDFDGDSAEFYYNIDDDTSWEKDFTMTQYLGGHVVGDWNPAVNRTSDISAISISILDGPELDEVMVRLANHVGPVHVRTVDGSSFTADVQVSRSRSHDHYGTRYSYGMKISRIDPEGFDAVPIDRYEVE